jgi:hypothetical protein
VALYFRARTKTTKKGERMEQVRDQQMNLARNLAVGGEEIQTGDPEGLQASRRRRVFRERGLCLGSAYYGVVVGI